MVYELVYTGAARRQITRLPKHIKARLEEAVLRLADEPHPLGCTKIQGAYDEWRIRVGEYRVRYSVDDDTHRVLVLKAGPRGDFYDK